jgi:hypothetical protein
MSFSPDSSKLAIAQTDAIVFVYKVCLSPVLLMTCVGPWGVGCLLTHPPLHPRCGLLLVRALPPSWDWSGETRRAFATASLRPALSLASRGPSLDLSRWVAAGVRVCVAGSILEASAIASLSNGKSLARDVEVVLRACLCARGKGEKPCCDSVSVVCVVSPCGRSCSAAKTARFGWQT